MAEEMIYDANGNATGYTQDPAAVAVAEAPTSTATLFGFNVQEILNTAREAAASAAATLKAASAVTGPPEAFINYISEQIKGDTPSPELVAETERLAKTLQGNAGLTQSLQEALIKNPELATLVTGDATDEASKLASLKSFNDTLANPDNARLVANVLEYAANTPDGAAAVESVMKLRDFAALHASGKATQEDYSKMDSYLTGIGIEDDRIDLAADPKKIWTMFMENPERLVQIMMNQFDMSGMDPKWQEMIAGALTWLTNGMSAFVDPNGDFVGFYNNEVVQPIGKALQATGQETLGYKKEADLNDQLALAGQGQTVVPAGEGSQDSNKGRFTSAATGANTAPADNTAQDEYDRQVAAWSSPKAAAPAGP